MMPLGAFLSWLNLHSQHLLADGYSLSQSPSLLPIEHLAHAAGLSLPAIFASLIQLMSRYGIVLQISFYHLQLSFCAQLIKRTTEQVSTNRDIYFSRHAFGHFLFRLDLYGASALISTSPASSCFKARDVTVIWGKGCIQLQGGSP